MLSAQSVRKAPRNPQSGCSRFLVYHTIFLSGYMFEAFKHMVIMVIHSDMMVHVSRGDILLIGEPLERFSTKRKRSLKSGRCYCTVADFFCHPSILLSLLFCWHVVDQFSPRAEPYCLLCMMSLFISANSKELVVCLSHSLTIPTGYRCGPLPGTDLA